MSKQTIADPDILIASYSEQVIDEYEGNKLIEALPPIMDDDELMEKFPSKVNYKSEQRQYASVYRKYFLTRLLRFFQPLPQHFDLYHRFSMALRDGYLDRNPSKYRAKELQNIYDRVQNGLSREVYVSEPTKMVNGFSMTGWSGIGKTTAINNVLKFFPKSIFHPELNIYQIVWLKVDCPKDGSLKQFCGYFFQAVDNILGTDYKETKWKSRETEDRLIADMVEVAIIHCIGVLIVDEIQNLSVAKAGGEENFLNFFVTLVNEFKLPIVLIGTNLALPILTKELRQSRRSLGLGSLAWDPLVPDDTWDFFIEELWQYRWLQTDQKLSNELREAFFYETQGIVDLLLKLFIFCQIAAIDEETEEITVELVHQVARKELVLVAGVIQAIRENDKQKLAKFRDIGFRELNEYFVKRIEETSSQAKPIAVEKIQHSAPESDSSVSLVVSMLTTLDIEEELARSVVYKIVEDKPHLDTISLSQEALKILKPDEKKKQTKRKKITEFEDGDLRGLWERAKQNDGQIYDELEASGYISLGIAV